MNGDLLDFACRPTALDQIELRRGSSMTYTSPSYIGTPEDQPRAPSRDIAFILRRPNPKNEACSVVLLAGIRGIGTWGASDHLRKQAKKLSARIAKNPGNAVENGFLAVLDVDYDNFDVVQTKIKDGHYRRRRRLTKICSRRRRDQGPPRLKSIVRHRSRYNV